MAQRTSLLFDVFVLNQAVRSLLSTAMAASPLRPDEYAVYSHILETPECTPTKMARDMNMPLQTVSDWLSVMRTRGHVTSRRRKDRRSYRVELTPAGREAHRAAGLTFEQGNRLFLAALPKTETEHRTELGSLIAAAATAHEAMIKSFEERAS